MIYRAVLSIILIVTVLFCLMLSVYFGLPEMIRYQAGIMPITVSVNHIGEFGVVVAISWRASTLTIGSDGINIYGG